MKSFIQIFLESIMDLEYALKVFEIDEVPSKDELKKLYKKLTLKNHPDRGGSNEQMALINTAYEFLMKQKTGSRFSGSSWKSAFNNSWTDRRSEKEIQDRNDLEELRAEETLKVFNEQYTLIKKVLPLYCDYFKKITNKEFTAELVNFQDYNQFKGKFRKFGDDVYYDMPKYVSWNIEIKNTDKDIIFNITMHTAIEIGGKKLAGEDHTITFNCIGIIDGRKNKLVNYSWYNRASAKKALTDPDGLFNGTKMQKILSGDARSAKKGSRFMKRDAFIFIEKILDGQHQTTNPDQFLIPICEYGDTVILWEIMRMKGGSFSRHRATASDPAYWADMGLMTGYRGGNKKYIWDKGIKHEKLLDKNGNRTFLECQENFERIRLMINKFKGCDENTIARAFVSEYRKIDFRQE